MLRAGCCGGENRTNSDRRVIIGAGLLSGRCSLTDADDVLSICISGAYQSGKTSFIAALAPVSSVAVDLAQAYGDIRAMLDYARVSLPAPLGVCDLYGQTGAVTLSRAMLYQFEAFVFLVDASVPDTDAEAAAQLKVLVNGRTPFVVAATKSDLPSARSADAIRETIDLPTGIPLYTCSAKDPARVRYVLGKLARFFEH
jgi:signal recognition particle receptor subunit beta